MKNSVKLKRLSPDRPFEAKGPRVVGESMCERAKPTGHPHPRMNLTSSQALPLPSRSPKALKTEHSVRIQSRRRRLLFVVNVDWFFVSHRLPIALEAMKRGYEVHLATVFTGYEELLVSSGITVHELRMKRGENNIFSMVASFFCLLQLLKRVRPDVLHLITIKPVLFGGIAARLANVPSVVAAISGLGYIFIAQGRKASVRRYLTGRLYRIALRQPRVKAIFQNDYDRQVVSRLASLGKDQAAIIRGSGVDLGKYSFSPLPDGVPIMMLAARLLGDKGVREFVKAARCVTARIPSVRFCLVGSIDLDNPSSITPSELDEWSREGVVELWGHQAEMHKILSRATIVVLPSYREGLPKVLIEAAACGRPVITTDVPGCRDAIVENETGVLVPPRNSTAIAEAIIKLLSNREKCATMGRAARRLAEREFDVEKVVAHHLSIYEDLVANAS